MRYLSVCAGIEAASVAWHQLGWEPVAYSEIEAFPSAVLTHHYQNVPNWGDMTRFKEWPDAAIDVLVGGTPCQSFSVAGLRGGLADPRGNLALTYLAIAERYKPVWLVWENVPGVLSADGGRALGAFLGGLAELGYGFAWRVLDAQYFGLAQRRKRVFVVGYLGDWRRAAAVLFDTASLRGDPPPGRETRKGIANSLTERPDRGGGNSEGQRLIPALTASGRGVERTGESRGQDPVIVHSLRAEGFDASEDGTGRGVPLVPDTSFCLLRGGQQRIDAESETLLPIRCGFNEIANALQTTADDYSRADGFNMIAFSCKDHGADAGELAPTLRSMAHDRSHANAGGQVAVAMAFKSGQSEAAGGAFVTEEYAPTLQSQNNGSTAVPCVAFDTTQITSKANYSEPKPGDPCHPLAAHAHAPAVAFDARQSDVIQYGDKPGPLDTEGSSIGIGIGIGSAVRRLTPRECERLQGFPDDYTLIPYRNKSAADGPRYKALGNSMAVPVMNWIGRRIESVTSLCISQQIY